MECWNCSSTERQGPNCAQCGQRWSPNPVQRSVAESRVDYLLNEARTWEWLAPERLESLKQEYQGRLQRLQAGPKPEPTSTPTAAKVARKPVQESLRSLQAAPELVPEPPKKSEWMTAAGEFLDQRNIRWFHTIGALLLISACVGYLRADWDGWGRQIVGLLLVMSPGFAFWSAHKTRVTLPESSRLLGILGGLLMPSGLIAFNHFGLGPVPFPADLWNGFAFAVSAAVLLWQAQSLKEVVCLYLGSFCLVMVGLPIGYTATSLLAIVTGGFYLYRGVFVDGGDWARHYVTLSQLLGGFGVLASFPTFWEGGVMGPLVLFVLGAAALATISLLTDHVPSLVLSALVSIFGTLMISWVLELPSLLVGITTLALGGVYLANAKGEKTKHLAQRFSAGFTAAVLLCIFTARLTVGSGLTDAISVIALSTSATIYYLLAARWLKTPLYLQTALLSAYFGWLQLGIYLHPGNTVSQSGWMLLFLGLVLAGHSRWKSVPVFSPLLILGFSHHCFLLTRSPELSVAICSLFYTLFWIGSAFVGEAKFRTPLAYVSFLSAVGLLPIANGWDEPISLVLLALGAFLVAVHPTLPSFWGQGALGAGLTWSLAPIFLEPSGPRLYLVTGVWVLAALRTSDGWRFLPGIAGLAGYGFLISNSDPLNLMAFAALCSIFCYAFRKGAVTSVGSAGAIALLVCTHSLANLLTTNSDLTVVCWMAGHALLAYLAQREYLPTWTITAALLPVLLRASSLSSAALGTAFLLYAGPALVLSWRRGQSRELLLSAALLPLATGLRWTFEAGLETTLWSFVCWSLAWVALEWNTRQRWPQRPWTPLGFALLFSIGLLGFGDPWLPLCAAAVASLRLPAFRERRDWTVAASLLQLCCWSWLNEFGIDRMEWYLLPLGVTLLAAGWYEKRDQVQWAGAAVLGLPPLWASMFGDPQSSLWVGAYGFALLLLGGFGAQRVCKVAGTALLLAEVGVQAVKAGVQLPWQVNAAVLGLGLVVAGVVFEMRRRVKPDAA